MTTYHHHSSYTTSNLLTLTQLILLIILLTTPKSSTSTSTSTSTPTKPFNKIYAFGDSYTDTGNTISTTGPSGFNYVSTLPYGMTYFHHPTNRYSDGRLVIDFVAEHLSLPFLPPYKSAPSGGPNGVNFAVAGATAIEHRFFVKNNLSFDITPESIGTELSWFNKVLEKQGCGLKCDALFDDALVWVGEIGANDYAYSVESVVSPKTVQSLAIRRISGFLQAILKKGAKYVVVQGLPPTGCLTLAMLVAPSDDRDTMGCVKSQNTLTATHNTLLQAEIQSLRKQFPTSTIVYADYYNAYRTVMENPSKYGFKELFKVCCGSGGGEFNYDFFSACGATGSSVCSNPSQYVNWDGVHLTEGMYKVISGLIMQGGYSYPSFQELIARKISRG